MEQVTIAGAIPPLVRLLSPPGGAGGGGKKAKGKKKAALPPAVELGIQNAAGALRHLTFYDPSVRMIVEAGGIKVRTPRRPLEVKEGGVRRSGYHEGCVYDVWVGGWMDVVWAAAAAGEPAGQPQRADVPARDGRAVRHRAGRGELRGAGGGQGASVPHPPAAPEVRGVCLWPLCCARGVATASGHGGGGVQLRGVVVVP